MLPLKEHVSTQVCIIGAGPAGTLLGLLLLEGQVDCLVVEQLSQEDVLGRAPRAGLIEDRTKELLISHGLADRMLAEGRPNRCCEFRMDGEGFVLDYAELCGGRSHWVYPQHELVADLIGTFLHRGGDIRFGMQAVAIEQRDQPQVLCRDGVSGNELVVDCAFVAGCDGFHGVARAAVLPEVCRSFERRYPFAWLAILAAVPPSSEHTIYALHPRGFAGHMLRSPNLTRFYLQVPRGSTMEEWPEERIWAELRTRLSRDGWRLTEGPIVGRSLLELRSSVVEPMQYGRLFLVGDAAHILTPAGGKGMNLALQDAEELALRLLTFYATGNQEPLSGYSAACLPRIWRAQEFSNWMIDVLHASSNEQPDGAYMHRIQQARLSHLRSSRSFATNFAENYVGL